MARLLGILLIIFATTTALRSPALPRPRAAVRCCDAIRPPPVLSGTQRRALRAQAGRLAADKVLNYVNVADVEKSRAEVDVQLTAVELVRCKFSVAKKAEAKVMAAELSALTGAAVAEVIGHTALLYRPGPKRLIRLDELEKKV